MADSVNERALMYWIQADLHRAIAKAITDYEPEALTVMAALAGVAAQYALDLAAENVGADDGS